MKLLNLFLILIILYLCYKIFNNNEKFQDGNLEQLETSLESGAALRTIHRIDLDNTEIINNKNIFINFSQDQLEELNKIPEIDLNKRNLIIDNSNANKEIPMAGDSWMSCNSCHFEGFNFTNGFLFKDTKLNKRYNARFNSRKRRRNNEI